MLRKATADDIQMINGILNHPDVYPGASGGRDVGVLDVTDMFEYLAILIHDSGKGCMILDPYDHLTCEVHTCLQNELHGAQAYEIAMETIRFAFAEMAVQDIVTRVDISLKSVDLFVRQNGFVRISDSSAKRSYELNRDRWPYIDKNLHQFAPAEFKGMIDDPHFAQVAGAVSLLGMRGFMGNAVAMYLKHARLHGYPRMEVVGQDSVMVGGHLLIHFDVKDQIRVEEVSWQPQEQS